MSDTPRTDAQYGFVTALRAAKERVEDSSLYKRFIDGTPLSNDIAVWIAQAYCEGADFARQLERELAEAQNILKQCLSIMPVGYIPTHTVENLPEMIGDLAKALAEETTEREQLERELTEMTKQRDLWKANLANQVVINRALRNRPDMGERARLVDELIKQRDTLAEALEECKGWTHRAVELEVSVPKALAQAQSIVKAESALAAMKGGQHD
jgi:predicted RNase H-like nuclease (RuvC/YqgF family)